MYINTFKYKPEDVSCVLCTEYVKKLGCTALSCPCLAERMEAGTVGYAEAAAELFPYRPRLTARIMRLAERFPGTMWQDDAHRKRMETLRLLLGCRKERDTPEFFRRAVSADLQQGACGQDLQLLLPRRHRLPLRPQARHLAPRLHAAYGGEKPLLPYGGGHAGRPC